MSTTIEAPAKKFNPTRDKITLSVLNALGTPPAYLQTKVIPLFDNRYRVNVYTLVSDAGTITKSQISDSFFVIADEDGVIQHPVIQKKY